jgi:3-hydroxyacyl-[acyl-carrier-protein] dehydratase
MPVTDLIPHRPPFLFVDEIVSESADGLVARRTWRPEEAFYQGHYPGAPITPGVLLCEAVFQTGALYLARTRGGAAPAAGIPLLAKIGEVRFRSPVFPGETTQVEVRKKEELGGFVMMSGSMKSGDKRVLSVEFSVAWKAVSAAGPSTSPGRA